MEGEPNDGSLPEVMETLNADQLRSAQNIADRLAEDLRSEGDYEGARIMGEAGARFGIAAAEREHAFEVTDEFGTIADENR